jgi:Phycobilisome protein
MHPQIDALFDEAESRYLKPEELGLINQFVESLPERLEAYRVLRDQEVAIMQPVADQLQAKFPQESTSNLERSIKNALLLMRYCAMGMLVNDEILVRQRLLSWLEQTAQIYNTQAIDAALYQLLNQRLSQTLTSKQMSFLSPLLTLAQTALLERVPMTA